MIDHVKVQGDYVENIPKHWLLPEHGMEHALLAYIEELEKRPLPKKAAKPKKKAKKRPCEDCGSKRAKHVTCPFASEIYNDNTLHWLCDVCTHNRAQEL
jgi:hypothetical protein